MRIRELFEDVEDTSGDLSMQLSAIVGEIADRVKDTGATNGTSIDSILSVLSDAGINISRGQFKDMSDSEPLNNIIASVEGDRVIFLGQKQKVSANHKDAEIDADKSSATIEKMAKRAEKRRD